MKYVGNEFDVNYWEDQEFISTVMKARTAADIRRTLNARPNVELLSVRPKKYPGRRLLQYGVYFAFRGVSHCDIARYTYEGRNGLRVAIEKLLGPDVYRVVVGGQFSTPWSSRLGLDKYETSMIKLISADKKKSA